MSCRSTRNWRSSGGQAGHVEVVELVRRGRALAMRFLRHGSISAFWWVVARLVNGKAARLRARRMRLEMTMSDSGPVPRSHSPRFGSRLSGSSGLRLPSGGSGRGAGRPLRSPRPRRPTSCGLAAFRSSAARRDGSRQLAACAVDAVDALQERFQHLAEGLVVVRAAEPALGLERRVCQTARRASVNRRGSSPRRTGLKRRHRAGS